MPHKAGKREETRKRILEAAGRGFRGHGYAGIGVDGVAREAGVTSGAFYAHFGSKDAAFRMALESGLDEVIEAIPRYRREHGPQWIDAFAAYYLSEAHREDLACGCAMTTLTPEVARADEEVHRVFETKMAVIADLIADGLAGGSRED
ncbi:MAG: TetR/AcrR family transcriptional regulator, partial [Rhodospirillales bacterium]|nr:TetR/AcrR family transcriptional regulator [Rhodospirillales bacterium]